MSSAALSEPQVLAHAKRRLFPEDDQSGTYAVVDTQFAGGEWLAGQAIEASVRETLAPFNHVRVGSGYPDLVGVRTLEPELLAVDRLGEARRWSPSRPRASPTVGSTLSGVSSRRTTG
nr:hypothetical protein [Halomicroarcula sp. SHR3]